MPKLATTKKTPKANVKSAPYDDLALLDLTELASTLHQSRDTVQTALYRRPETLPPGIKIPGSRVRLWRRKTVIDWLAAHEEVREAPSQRTRRLR